MTHTVNDKPVLTSTPYTHSLSLPMLTSPLIGLLTTSLFFLFHHDCSMHPHYHTLLLPLVVRSLTLPASFTLSTPLTLPASLFPPTHCPLPTLLTLSTHNPVHTLPTLSTHDPLPTPLTLSTLILSPLTILSLFPQLSPLIHLLSLSPFMCSYTFVLLARKELEDTVGLSECSAHTG
jgi:hypothetical protein